MSKKYFLLFSLLFTASIISAQPVISFENKTKKFEKTRAGIILNFDYAFVNKGDQPLLISEVKVTCGCTTPEFPKEPIKPGGKGIIHVKFDTKGKIGYQDRILEVVSNAKNPNEKLRFKGMVDNKKNDE